MINKNEKRWGMVVNKLELKILNSLSLGVNRLHITELSKEIDCCRPVIYKYLKRLAMKGYIKPHTTETISGGTTGDKVWVTIIEKIKA